MARKKQGRQRICSARINGPEASFHVWNDFRNKFFHNAELGTGQGIQLFVDLFPHFRGVLLFGLLNLYNILDPDLKNTAEAGQLVDRKIPFPSFQLSIILGVKAELLCQIFLRHVIQKAIFFYILGYGIFLL